MRTQIDVGPLLQGPIAEFVRESRVRLVLLIDSSGQVLAQHGFARVFEVVNVAALAAAAHASSKMLASLCDAGRWQHLHQDGSVRQYFLAPIRTPAMELVIVALFERDSSLGLVQFFASRLAKQIAALDAFRSARPLTDPEHFERELEIGLDRLFAPSAEDTRLDV